MFSLNQIYRPITASPFQNGEEYCEIEPCEALKPFIRCFWGTLNPISTDFSSEHGLVIPDTCMDIIFNVDYKHNNCGGFFCTVDEKSYLTTSGACEKSGMATFAIRFYAWTAILFSETDFRNSKNSHFSVDEFFSALKSHLEPLLFDVPTLRRKIEIAENFLLKNLHTERINSDLMNALYFMLSSCGRAKISDIRDYTAVSEKQLERIFNYNMGISPKAFSSLLRYQLLWQEMVYSPNFNVLDAVEKYGYSDQSHLLNDFKRRHLLTPKEAVEFACKNR